MSRYAYCVFCDDIRHELAGKHSFMGVYQGKLIVTEFPAVIHKLFAVIHIVTPQTRPFKSLEVTIEYNGQEMFRLPDTEGIVRRLASHASDASNESTFQGQVSFSPLHLEKPGMIKVKIVADGKKIPCGGLIIEADPNLQSE
ncbi:DUF6941 family protein [Pseudomonas sp. SP16.1]|uniref:DUF6941 family protein n=1 Tax=Pseudomonas sp. SP16.1 TaxID=3458854 RepID=UPI004045512A